SAGQSNLPGRKPEECPAPDSEQKVGFIADPFVILSRSPCHRHPMEKRISSFLTRIVFGLIVFAVLATSILLQPPKHLLEFDQLFYVTLAYDLEHHGVLSNGVFDDVDSTVGIPPPGKFFGPVYPALVAAVMRLDHRFATAIDCAVGVNEGMRKF